MVPQPLSQQERIEVFVANVEEARNFVAFEAPQASMQRLDNIKEQFKRGFKFVEPLYVPKHE